MAWLIGAIAIYGIVTLLIGIAVLVYLDGDREAQPEARDPETRRQAARSPMPIGHSRQHAASGTRPIGAR
jgi:hypothetical protein